MIEIPESNNLALQCKELLIGKTVKNVIPPTKEHKFCWYNGDPYEYKEQLIGRYVDDAFGHGSFVDITFGKKILTLNDGVNIRYYEEMPDKVLHQLLIEFTDGSCLVFTVAMYGGIYQFEGNYDNIYYKVSNDKPSPLSNEFNENYFDGLFAKLSKNLSAKAFLATEQRIPGLCNGSLQDILLTCNIHPKRKIETLSDFEKDEMFNSVKEVLKDMTNKGGRDTEKDIYGNFGKYRTLLSKKTVSNPCPICGGIIVKEKFLGGSIYYCESCQKL